jgi:serine phosphatase RsbU (regulator of sigma subunit)/ABC-type amino acid transport substrate-binding protein
VFIKLVAALFFLSISFISIGQSPDLDFNSAEKKWIKDHPVVLHGYDPEWMPIGHRNSDGKFEGISADYLSLVEELTGIDFVAYSDIQNWNHSLELIQQDEIILLPALAQNDERDGYLDFTRAYLSFSFVIVTPKNSEFIGSIADLDKRKVALPEDYYIADLLEKEPYDIDFIYEDGVKECMFDLVSGKAEAMVANLAVVSYYLNYEGFDNLKIAAPTTYSNIDVKMGVAKGNLELVSILEKAITSISNKEKNEIIQNWISVEYDYGVNMKKVWNIVGIVGGAILLLFASFFYWNRKLSKEVRLRKGAEANLQESYEKITVINQNLALKNTEITDSINYAWHLQKAILPTKNKIDSCFPNNFVIYRPKDIVAGDFYWLETIEENGKEYVFYAAADCTGHGVPGAMVSFVCSNALSSSVKEFNLRDPGKILDKTAELVVDRFDKGDEEVKDGMDVALCVIEKKSNEKQKKSSLKFSSANNDVWIISKDLDLNIEGKTLIIGDYCLYDIRADHQPVGKFDDMKPFRTVEVELHPGDRFFMYSDGYADQFGGDNGKKLKIKNFKKLVLDSMTSNIEEQKEIIDQCFLSWKQDYEQVDDVIVIGIEI